MIFNKLYFFISLISLLSIQTLLISYNSSTLNRLALLISTFIKIGLDYKILDFYFLGLTYIIVYVGAISILFLFVIMITDTGKTPNSPLMNKNKESNIYAITILLLFTFPLIYNYFNLDNNDYIMEYFIPSYNTEFFTFTDIQSLGYMIYLAYPIIIILQGILLWCVLIGILRISGL